MSKYEEILIGRHAFGKAHSVLLKDEARRMHTHIIGGSGTGKSKLMEYMLRQDIRNGKGVCLLDPHGSLFEAMLKWVIANGFAHRLVVIDPNEKEYSVGINFLEYDQEVFDVGQHIENIIKDIGKARNEDIFNTSHVVIWLRSFLQLAAKSHLTFYEVYHLLNEDNKDLRNRLTEQIDDQELKWQLQQAWQEYDSASPRTRSEIMKLPVWNRMQTFLSTRTMKNIIGQSKTTVDFYKAMEKGQIVLANLHGRLSENEKKLLGIILIDKIYQAAQKRKADRGKLFYVYIDEFGSFVSERIAHALEELRKRRVAFILAHQELEQLKDSERTDDQRLLASIMTNAKIKVAFRISRQDAEAMALEMFGGFISGGEIKHEQKTVGFRPIRTTARSYASGKSISRAEATGIFDGMGEMSNISSGMMYMPGHGFGEAGAVSSFSNSSGMGSSSMSGQSRSNVEGYSESELEMEFPFYDQVPFEQVVSTTFYSVEEVKERYIQFLQNQQERFFHLRIVGQTTQAPIALITPTVEEARILPSMAERIKMQSIQKYSKSVLEVEKLFQKKRDELLNWQGTSASDPELDEDNFEQDYYEPPK